MLLKLLYAVQSPYNICFGVVSELKVNLMESRSSSEIDDELVAMHAWAHNFRLEAMSFKYMEDLVPLGEHEVFVMLGCVYLGNHRLASHDDWVQLEKVLEHLPEVRKRKASSEESQARGKWKAELVAHPWLAELLSAHEELAEKQPRQKSTPSSTSASATASHAKRDDAEAPPKDAHEVGADEVFAALYDRREEWHLRDGAKSSDFTICLLGGKWTMDHLGVPYDAFQGKSASGAASAWCARFSLPKSGRFSIAAYSEATACIMATAWCGHMQHLYDLWVLADDDSFRYTKDTEQWREPEEFSRVVAGSNGQTLKRCEQIRAIRPTR